MVQKWCGLSFGESFALGKQGAKATADFTFDSG
jgi:hypothetical protein